MKQNYFNYISNLAEDVLGVTKTYLEKVKHIIKENVATP